jgi:hypothetical protein
MFEPLRELGERPLRLFVHHKHRGRADLSRWSRAWQFSQTVCVEAG